jgi:hypothetical protein
MARVGAEPPGGGPPDNAYYAYYDGERRVGGVGSACPPEGVPYNWMLRRYPAGTSRERFLPEGTTPEEDHLVTPLCEIWRNANDEVIEPPVGHQVLYPLFPLTPPAASDV